TTTTTAPNQPNINVLSAQSNPTSTLTFGQPNGPAAAAAAAATTTTTTTMLTGQAGLSVQQQINQQAQRN
ncbi:unnamed protein product, partial [Rotaria socialis]